MLVPASALLLAATLAAPADLDPAREAFARGDFAAAESLALAVAQPPLEGAALYLAGLARFRAGRPAEALEAFDRAARAPDAPAGAELRYNRAACLYELGRFAEAEVAFVAAADDGVALMAVALINAGFAALDAGAPERARALAARARAIASGSSLQLLADLDAHLAAAAGDQAAAAYKDGLASFDAGRFAEARDRFRAAAALDPADGRSRIMAGAASIKLGDRPAARSALEEALALALPPADEQAARGWLDSISQGFAARPLGWEGVLTLGGGFDSNALQVSTPEGERTLTGLTSAPSGFLSGGASLAWRGRLRPGLRAELAWSLDQLAYLSSSASDWSPQTHALSAALELAAGRLRLGAALGGSFAFTGLSGFRALQAGAGPSLWAALDESDRFTTRLDLAWEHKGGFGEFGYLGGDRLDAALAQELRLEPLTLSLGYRLRGDLIGAATTAGFTPVLPPRPQVSTEPFGYTSHTLWATARAAPLERLRLDLSGGLELRRYLDDASVTVTDEGVANTIDRGRRSDARWFGSAAASLWLFGGLWLQLRYDLVINSSTQTAPDRSYDKQVVTLSTAWTF